jgi:hypothetical protein
VVGPSCAHGICFTFMKAEGADEREVPGAQVNAPHQRTSTTELQPKPFPRTTRHRRTANNRSPDLKVTWHARGRVRSTERDSLSTLSTTTTTARNAYRGTHPRRIQIISRQDTNHRMGSLLQRHHWPQRFWKAKTSLDAICFVLGLTNMSSVSVLHGLCGISPLIRSPIFRCVRRISRILSTNVGKPVSRRPRSPSSLTTRTGKIVHLEWRTLLR